MKTTFIIEDNIAILYDDNYFDLHNDFDLKEIKFNLVKNDIIMCFERTIKQFQISPLIITHKNIASYKFESTSAYSTNNERFSLSHLTYLPSTEKAIDINTLLIQKKPNQGDSILYVFDNDSYLRILCDEIILSY